MELIQGFIDLIVHLDRHLLELVGTYGGWVYAILFLIVFCETGLVVTPFLPGDSLLFVAGTVAATGAMDVHALVAAPDSGGGAGQFGQLRRRALDRAARISLRGLLAVQAARTSSAPTATSRSTAGGPS